MSTRIALQGADHSGTIHFVSLPQLESPRAGSLIGFKIEHEGTRLRTRWETPLALRWDLARSDHHAPVCDLREKTPFDPHPRRSALVPVGMGRERAKQPHLPHLKMAATPPLACIR